MLHQALHLLPTLAAAPPAHADSGAAATPGGQLLMLVPALCVLAALFSALSGPLKIRSKIPGYFSVACLAGAFVAVLLTYLGHESGVKIAHGFEWITFKWGDGPGQALTGNFAFYVDSLTLLWMLFVTGLGALIALYSVEYMADDVGLGYARYFFAFNIFVLSMSCLVMADNLLLLFLGWEGVGLCSYLLIGYFYKKPVAVAAAKKAFIVNRIGDLGLVLGLLATFVAFGTLGYDPLFAMIRAGVDAKGAPIADSWVTDVIPLLLMAGAFGKSAQVFFYVWLPDAMEGPTPVSALIHAATMVTAGVFLIARMYPLYAADDDHMALSLVAWCGAITALWSATIGMSIFDIKRVMGYSTISQLGYMFAGLGLLAPTGAAFHTLTHAFFKATLFLAVGAVMHGFGGQLDLRRLSGVARMRGFGIVGLAMLVGSLNLSGVPGTAGFFSKDMILAQGFSTPASMIEAPQAIAWVLLLTAGLTAYYTFRAFFRVFTGPVEYLPGDDEHLLEHGRHPKGTTLAEWHKQHGHGHGHDHAHTELTGVAARRAHGRKDFDPTTEEFDPHPPGWAINASLVICALLAIAAAALYFVKTPHAEEGGWVGGMIERSSAAFHSPHEFNLLGITSHSAMYLVSALVGLTGIAVAAFLHAPKGWQGLFLGSRDTAATSRADALTPRLGRVARWARAKWYVDELYDWFLVKPLRGIAYVSSWIDKLLVDGLVDAAGALPARVGRVLRPSQSGVLHGYAAGMAGGVALVLLLVLIVLN
ncbi:MAG: NADH-quinone oxidoreductase subunit L [Phycisphaerae bacterium]|nr:NADH-quinone oxidoreductase subunit L [Phycisphaerae bacterium]